MTNKEQQEEREHAINDLSWAIWPRLDSGESRDEIMSDINSVIDAWTPKPDCDLAP